MMSMQLIQALPNHIATQLCSDLFAKGFVSTYFVNQLKLLLYQDRRQIICRIQSDQISWPGTIRDHVDSKYDRNHPYSMLSDTIDFGLARNQFHSMVHPSSFLWIFIWKKIFLKTKYHKNGYILKTLKVVQSKMALNPFHFGCVEDKGITHVFFILFRDGFDLRILHTD